MIQAPDSGAATPAQSTPATPAPGAPTPAPAPVALSTSVMTDRIRDQLTGKKTTATPPVPGSEPSPATPGQTPPSSSDPAPPPAPGQPAAPEPDEDDPEAAPGAFPPEAVAALSRERKAKREAKATAKALAEENAALKLRLAPPQQQAPTSPLPPSPAPALDTPKTESLIAAEQLEAEQEGLRNWARTQVNAIQRAVQNGDATAALANLQTHVSKYGVQLPADAEAVLDWLGNVRTDAEDKLEKARIDVLFQRQQSQQRGEAIRTNSQALASEWAPQMDEAGSKQAERAEMIRNYFPNIEQHPLGPRFIAAAIRGWEVIDAELTAKGTKPAAGKPATAAPPAARLPNTPPPVIPLRPSEGKESSSAVFAKLQAAQNDPTVPAEERDRLKREWVKAGLEGR